MSLIFYVLITGLKLNNRKIATQELGQCSFIIAIKTHSNIKADHTKLELLNVNVPQGRILVSYGVFTPSPILLFLY